jgi:uncharacterized protein YfcZ (UPF0381/DUF406 family)
MKGYPAPLTWERILELAAQGHDHYDAALTSDRARQLVASVREHVAAETAELQTLCMAMANDRDISQVSDDLAAANATLERVLDLADSTSSDGNTWVYLRDLRAAIDGQPEAPKVCTECEAPIGPGRHFCQPEDFHQTVRDALARDLAAANARIAELETQHDADIDAIARAVRHEDAANARADAAERLNEKLCEDLHVIARDRHEAQRGFDNALKVLAKDDECVARLQQNYAVCAEARDLLKAERDQLAAANARLEQAIERWKVAFAEACTPEERKVLESAGEIRQWVLEDWAYQPHGAQSFARAELANRAAKALKPPAEPSDRS